MRLLKILVAAAAIAFAVPASANVITFETAPLGAGFTGPVIEDGFVYSNGALFLFVNNVGNPGQDMEGTIADGGGVLEIRRVDGGLFTFDSVDFAAWDETGSGFQELIVGAVWQGFIIGFDTYSLANTSVFVPALDNWTTEFASVLAGQPMDTMFIILGAGTDPNEFYSAIDNLALSPIPEPATLLLFGAGLLGFAARRRAARVL